MPPIGYIGSKHKAKLRKMWKWIEKFQSAHSFPPSRREIAQEFCTSTSVVGFDLECMERLGWVCLYPTLARGLKLLPMKGE